MGSRAGRALDRPAHGRRGVRARRRPRESGDDAKLLDELGDVLFQVHFLSLLLEERGHGSLAEVADHVHAKLVRRHPHIFGEVEVESSGEVLQELGPDQEGRGRAASRGSSATCRRTCPGRCTRSRRSGGRRPRASTSTTCPTSGVRGELDELEEASTREERFHEVGDVLFAAVNVARKLKVDPELALRASSERFRGRVEAAEELAARRRRRVGRARHRRAAVVLRAGHGSAWPLAAVSWPADEPDRNGPRTPDP